MLEKQVYKSINYSNICSNYKEKYLINIYTFFFSKLNQTNK